MRNKIIFLSIITTSIISISATDCLQQFINQAHHALIVYELQSEDCIGTGIVGGDMLCQQENDLAYNAAVDQAVDNYDGCCQGSNTTGCP